MCEKASQPASNLITEARGVLNRNRGRWPEADWQTLDQFVRLASDEPDSRIIETVEQLDALPNFTVVHDRVNTVWEKEWHCGEGPWWQTCSEAPITNQDFRLPARVLYHPEHDR